MTIVAAELALLVAVRVFFDDLPIWALLLLGMVVVFLTCTHFQCSAHNHIHNPLFRSDRLNRLFSIASTLLLGVPHTLYRFHHFNHHAHNNDLVDPAIGTTKDLSSIYRHSKAPGKPEHVLSYALLGPFRGDVVPLYRMTAKRGMAAQVWLELAALIAFVGALSWGKPAYLLFYVPVYYLGQAAALAENYAEHYGAQPGNRFADSVSCYGRLYNRIWFNNGFHQEHHAFPQVHWTRIPERYGEMLPEAERRVVRHAHWFNMR